MTWHRKQHYKFKLPIYGLATELNLFIHQTPIFIHKWSLESVELQWKTHHKRKERKITTTKQFEKKWCLIWQTSSSKKLGSFLKCPKHLNLGRICLNLFSASNIFLLCHDYIDTNPVLWNQNPWIKFVQLDSWHVHIWRQHSSEQKDIPVQTGLFYAIFAQVQS